MVVNVLLGNFEVGHRRGRRTKDQKDMIDIFVPAGLAHRTETSRALPYPSSPGYIAR